MPYIADYGQRPWSEVINEVGGGIRGAIAQRQASDEADVQKETARQEQNRALHPATQKWLRKVMSGEMTPAEASVGAHSEIDALQGQAPADAAGVQAPDPSMMASGGKLGSPGVDQGQMPQAPQPQQGLRAAIQAPERPFTVRDAGDLEKLAPVVSAARQRPGGLSESDAESRIRLKAELEGANTDKKEAGKTARAGAGITSREHMQNKQLQARAAEAVTNHEDKLSAIKGRLDVAIQNGASAKEVAGIKAEAMLIASDDSASARELQSIMRDDKVDEDTRRLAADANNRRAELRARIGSAQPVPSYGGPGAVQGPAAPGVPIPPTGAAPLAPSPQTPDIPPVIPNLGIPPALPTSKPVQEPPAAYGPPAADLNALPPARGGQRGTPVPAKSKTVKMKFPSGSVHDVDLADVDAMAKNKGAVVVQGSK